MELNIKQPNNIYKTQCYQKQGTITRTFNNISEPLVIDIASESETYRINSYRNFYYMLNEKRLYEGSDGS